MKIGVSTASFYPLETELSLEEVGKHGVKLTELFFNAEMELKPSFVDMLADIKDSYGMEIPSIHTTMSLAESFMIFSRYERRFRESLNQFAIYSEAAAKLGAKYIVMHGGKPNGLLTDEEYCERYMMLKEVTKKNGVTVLQENVKNHRSSDREFLLSMIDILGDEAEFCYDVKQALRSGYEPIGLLEDIIGNVKHLHISDHSVASDCLLPLNGNFDFKSFFTKLKNFGYNGSAVIEVYKDAYNSYDEIFESHKNIKNLGVEIFG